MKPHELIAQQRAEIANLKGLVAQLACELEAAQNVTIRIEEVRPAREYNLRPNLSAHGLHSIGEIVSDKAAVPNPDREAFRAFWRARVDNLDGEVK